MSCTKAATCCSRATVPWELSSLSWESEKTEATPDVAPEDNVSSKDTLSEEAVDEPREESVKESSLFPSREVPSLSWESEKTVLCPEVCPEEVSPDMPVSEEEVDDGYSRESDRDASISPSPEDASPHSCALEFDEREDEWSGWCSSGLGNAGRMSPTKNGT